MNFALNRPAGMSLTGQGGERDPAWVLDPLDGIVGDSFYLVAAVACSRSTSFRRAALPRRPRR